MCSFVTFVTFRSPSSCFSKHSFNSSDSHLVWQCCRILLVSFHFSFDKTTSSPFRHDRNTRIGGRGECSTVAAVAVSKAVSVMKFAIEAIRSRDFCHSGSQKEIQMGFHWNHSNAAFCKKILCRSHKYFINHFPFERVLFLETILYSVCYQWCILRLGLRIRLSELIVFAKLQ